MNNLNNTKNRRFFKPYLLIGLIGGTIGGVIEYFVRKGGEFPQELIPLLIRAISATLLMATSVAFFELLTKNWLKQKPFVVLVMVRSVTYTLIITFMLTIVNGVWEIISRGFSFWEGVLDYIANESYPINLATILLALIVIITIQQINSLHRKGELLEFVLGKYHEPKEVNRIFCFIDLKGSTTIGEKLGHYQFGLFLKDYYSDITDAIRETEAEIYQYVGDEIILFWPYKRGLKNNNFIRCFFIMKDTIDNLKDKYLGKYGMYPEFKAGLHGGKVTITWVGEIKKEIIFIGDVLNTTSRLQESCKRLSKDFLISKTLLDLVNDLDGIKASFMEETILRGKEKAVKIYSLENIGES